MPVITLTSDWGTKDHYLASVKGAILKQLPEARIIDISHQIPPHNLAQAAFIIRNCYKDFPEGSIHIIGVSTEESEEHPHTVVYADGQYFIGSDNGIFSLIFNEKPEKIVEITLMQDSEFFTFSSRDRFVKAAAMLVGGAKIEELGEVRDKLNEKILFAPVVEQNVIKGMVIYVDNYENAITNISVEKFKEVGKNKKFTISFRGEDTNKLCDSYSDVPVGEIVALFGCNGHLEIAMNHGNASGLLGLNLDAPVRIEFHD